ncbi:MULTISPECIES: hypothetical protein [Hyphomicrobiales]|uniref:hypothetical protein n=2 Tax=Hyphomicrobiales TaxID=356 RepID=UPI000F66426A|nr:MULTISPECIES: hypothetical protein [Hyphomicrobiales]MCQ9147381.1 hypothetical protein [Ochrobactrum sp. BTU2]MDH1270301.1 hypothetical protein [Agrobacterium pusense]
MQRIGVVLGGALLAAVMYAAPASAQSTGCGIQQAADLAVQRQIALLDAAKVDSSQYFNGANSCLGSSLLNSFDLSNLIPTSFDFLGNIGSQLIDQIIQQATQQVCQVLNNQLQNIVGKINNQMYSFDSAIGSQMSDLLGGSGSSISPINIPNLPNIGQYTFTTSTVSGSGSPTQPIFTPPAGNSGSNGTNSGGGTAPDLFNNMFAPAGANRG